MKTKICEICGRVFVVQDEFRNQKVCSRECRVEAGRIRAREYNRTHRIKEHGTVAAKVRHKAGWDELASAIVNTAIEDIRRLSKKKIEEYNKPGCLINRKDKFGIVANYLNAKAFLLSPRCSGLIDMDGEDIFKMLMDEKGVSYEGK